MKKLFWLIVLAIGFCLNSCSEDEDPQAPLSGLAAFLNGPFKVNQVDYDGALRFFLGNVPLNGTGNGTQGIYNFDARANFVAYQVVSTMEVEIFGQNEIVPINVNGSGPVNYVNANQFTIDDPRYGLMTYDVSEITDSSLLATTNYQNDTLGGILSLELDLYMEKF